MFNFMKKGVGNTDKDKEDKEKKKKEKREKNENRKRERRSMTAEELLRLDEVRRSLKIRSKKKEKDKLPSGITADYSANFLAELRERECGESSSEASLTSLTNPSNSRPLPPVPPLPPKRGILKQAPKSLTSPCEFTERDSIILVRNTIQNEVIAYQNVLCGHEGDACRTSPGDNSSIGSGDQTHSYLTPPVVITNHDSIESLEDSTTNSSFVTPPFSLSPVGDCHGMDLEFPLPELQPVGLPEPRTLTIQRQPPPRNDFGFSLRKAMIVKRDYTGACQTKPVIFAEPGAIAQHCNDTGLLPGDQLLSVNGHPVDKKTREEVIDMIKSSGSSVTLKVQPVSELSELSYRSTADGRVHKLHDSNIRSGTLKRSASYRFNRMMGKCEDQMPVEAEWYWLVHRGGFSEVYPVQSSPASGKITVQLHSTGENIIVDEDDIEKANPHYLDKSENLGQLHYVNESSALHLLRQRYGSNLIHTYAGNTLLVINPMASLSIYSEKVVQMFRGCKSEDMPPHIYSVAQATYRSMLASRRDHSIVLLGRSGSGKSMNYKHLLYYLSLIGSANKVFNPEKLQAVWTVLEAFGNAKTILNVNATRFTHVFSIDFDQSGQISSASLQMLLIDRWRLIKRREGESIFHVFYYLLHGAEGALRRELSLDHLSHNNPLISTNSSVDERNKACIEFSRLCNAFTVLEVTEAEVEALWSVIAAILHLGVAGAHKSGTNNRWQFREVTSAQRACNLLGFSIDELTSLLFEHSSPTHMMSSEIELNGLDMLEGLIIGLYQEVISVVTGLINRNLTNTGHSVSSILVVDCPGWQTPSTMGSQYTATMNDLFQNYLAEKLQGLYFYTSIISPLQKYNQEDIEVPCNLELEGENNRLLSVLECVGSSLGSSSQIDIRHPERRPGILWIMEEMAAQPAASDSALNEKIFMTYSDRESRNLMSKGPDNHHIILQHCQGTNPVLYSTEGWLKQARENPMIRMSTTILQDSTKGNVNTLFSTWRSGNLNGSLVGLDGLYTINRGSSLRRTATSSASSTKRRSAVLQVKFTVDGLLETIRRTRLNFVHCLLPHENAGLADLSSGQSTSSLINVPLFRAQLRGFQILPAVRLYKQGFPESLPLTEFNRKFVLLANPESKTILKNADSKLRTSDQETAIALEIMQEQELDLASYRIGINQIFTRTGVLSQLETLRDEKLSNRISRLQACCRGYLARKRFAKRKVEDVAVRCIQRNVRKFLKVRDWPWWRLLVRVTPLLNVHRTEEQLKAKTEELEVLKMKMEKLEQERAVLKMENGKLEVKISELAVDLAEEHSTCTYTSERLNVEKNDRLRLAKELQQLQSDKKRLEENSERLELELVCARTVEMNGVDMESEDGEFDSVSKGRYERVLRELEYTKRRMHQQHEHDMDQLMGLKKQLEKKLADTFEELEEQRQVVAQWKRKVNKLNAEMNDVRLLLEEQNSRNNLLEKKQRKFDSEFQLLTEELKQEKLNKERIIREKDLVSADKCTLEQNVNSIKLELELKEQQAQSLSNELNELLSSGSTEEDIAFLKKIKHQLESKVNDQEEELDDLAGQVQLLEQAKLKLEMSIEQQRKENRRELAQRDEELEEIRANTYKKVKALESQLETEHEQRTAILRERHELERRISDAEESSRQACAHYQDHIHKLRKDLKKTKALLRDAQITIQQSQADTPNKALLRQLRNQLEDLECARAAAVKSKLNAEVEIAEAVSALDEAEKARKEAEEKVSSLTKEKSNLQLQLDENEEELAEVLKKYSSTVSQLTSGQLTLQEQTTRIAELEIERSRLKEQVAELQSKLENMEMLADPSSSFHVKKYQLKSKELESKLELEQTTRTRIEVQMARLKESSEKAQNEMEVFRSKEAAAQESLRKTARALREAKETNALLAQHDADATAKKKELEKRLESAEAETAAVRADLRLAMQRIEDLQCAIQGDLDDGAISGSDGSATDSESSDDSVPTFQGKQGVNFSINSKVSYYSADGASAESSSEAFTHD